MKILSLLFLLTSLFPGMAQAQENPHAALLRRVRAEVEALCSERMAGRGYIDGGHKVAADYIARRMGEIGLLEAPGSNAPGATPYQQSYLIRINLVSDASLQFDGKALAPGTDFIAHATSGSGAGSYKVKDLGYGLKASASVRGKIAVFRDGWPAEVDANPAKKAKYSDRALATDRIAALMPYEPAGIVVLKDKLTASFRAENLGIPVLELKTEHYPARPKRGEISASASVEVIRTQNVLGMVEGSVSPDTVLIVCGHYDHLGKLGPAVFPGANDNASGIAMLLSMAEWFADPAHAPRYSMLFIAFGAEETGLAGSRYYVESDPRFPLARTRFVLNLDLMGNGVQGITAVGGKDFPLHFERLERLNDSLLAVPKVNARPNAPNSDHYFFLEQGVPGFFIYTLGGPTHYHDVYDTPQNLELSRFAEVRELLIRFLAGFL